MSLSETFFEIMPETREFPARALKFFDNLINLDFKTLSFEDAAKQYWMLDNLAEDISYYSENFIFDLSNEEQAQVDLFLERFSEFKETMEYNVLKFAYNCQRDKESKIYKMTLHGGSLAPMDDGFIFERTFVVSLHENCIQQFLDSPEGVIDFKGPLLYDGHSISAHLVLFEKPRKEEKEIARATLSHTREEIYYMLVNVLSLVIEREENTQT